MNATQSAILRALKLAEVLDVEHTDAEAHAAFRAVRHELRTLRDLHVPQAPERAVSVELKSAQTGRGTTPGSLRHKILAVLQMDPLADFQVRDLLARDRRDAPEWPRLGQVRRRRHELVAAGWVEAVILGARFRKVTQETTGRECTVYQLTDLGDKALRRLRSGQTVLFSVDEQGNDSVTTPDKAKGATSGP